MEKSLDGLIRHLVDQIALCGEYGTLPSDLITHVKAYYLEDSEQVSEPAINGFFHEALDTAPNVDGLFLEYVWKWLVRDKEIRVGKSNQYANLTLSEAEAANAFARTSDSPHSTTEALGHHTSIGASQESVPDETSQTVNATSVVDIQPREESATKAAIAVETSKSKPGIRLYTSDTRMWYAITGHGPDLFRVKNLDFVCLSIIAACGINGILQHDLIRISGQDKRSLPSRTDRLRDDGYIVKRRVTVRLQDPVPRLLHTSVCTLKRFSVTTDGSAGKQVVLTEEVLTSEQRKRPNDRFEHGRRVKLNASASAKERPGGVEDESSEPEGDVAGGHALSHKRPPVSEETEQDIPAPEKRRTIPQWTPETNVNNQIFDLVDQSGTRGMTFAEIRDNLFGENARKPLEQYMSRLVDSWQLSQPLHLRHLTIVRDAVLKGKSPIYIYYTFKNFKNLVDNGKGSWEAVTASPSSGSKKGKDVAATLCAASDLDEYDFPILNSSLFLGRHNDATLAECVAAIDTSRLYFSARDPIATSEIRATKLKRPTTAVAKGRGRPRKYPRSGNPANIHNLPPKQIKHLHRSQQMAEKYQKSKVEDEILRRTENGEDPVKAAHEVLEETHDQRLHEGEGPLSVTIVGQILHRFAGEPLPPPTEDTAGKLKALLPGLTISKERGPQHQQNPYWPSIAAHTFPNLDSFRSVLSQPALQDSQAGVMETNTRTRRVPPPKDMARDMPYSPSVAAHSQSLRPTDPAIMSTPLQAKRKIGRPPKRKHSTISPPQFHYPPSTLAHSGVFHPPILSVSQESTAKRRKVKQETVDQREPLAGRPVRESRRSSTMPARNPLIEKRAQWRAFMTERFLQQLSLIHRPHDGVFFGETTIQRKRKSEPQGTGGPHRLAVFRIDSLKNLDWFEKRTPSPGAVPHGESQSQDLLQSNLESSSDILTTPIHARPLATNDVVMDASSKFAALEVPPNSSIVLAEAGEIDQDRIPITSVLDTDKGPPEVRVTVAGASISPAPSLETFTAEGSVPSSDAADPNPSKEPPTTNVPHLDREDKPIPKSITESRSVLADDSLQISDSHGTSGELADEDVARSSASQIEGPELDEIVAIVGEPDVGHEASLDVVERSIEQPTLTKPKLQERPSVRRNRQGGSTALLRRDIIMGLVEKCEGVCPGTKELTLPFVAEWKKRGQEGTPEQSTVNTAINALCAAGRLQQITFSFQTKHGLTLTKTMLTRPEISTTDPRVKETQLLMIERHPYIYLPRPVLPGEASDIQPADFSSNQDTADPSDIPARFQRDPKRTDPHKRLEGIKRAMKKIERSDEARPVASTRIPRDKGVKVSRLKVPSQSKREIEALSRIARPIVTKRKVERLASAKKSEPKSAQNLNRSITAPEMEKAQCFDQPEPLMWLPAAYAFSEENHEVDRPVLSELAADETVGHQKAGQYRQMGETQNFTADEQARHRIRQMADKAALIERNHAGANQSYPSLLYMDIGSKVPFAPNHPPSPSMSSHQPSGLRTGVPSAHSSIDPSLCSVNISPDTGDARAKMPTTLPPSTYVSPAGQDISRNESRLPVASANVDQSGSIPIKDFSVQTTRRRRSTFSYETATSREATTSPPPISLDHIATIHPRRRYARNRYKWRPVPSYMHPIHVFHPASGTFSVNFSGFELVRLKTPAGGSRENTSIPRFLMDFRPVSVASSLLPPPPTWINRFEADVDHLMNWELQTQDIENAIYQGWPFVNYTFPHSHELSIGQTADINAAYDVSASGKNGRLVNRRLKPTAVQRPRKVETISSTRTNQVPPSAEPAANRSKKKMGLKRQRLTSLAQEEVFREQDEPAPVDSPGRPTKLRRLRGPRTAKSLGENGEVRLMATVMIIRTLTGGLEKRIDWLLVAKVFEQESVQSFIQSRYNYLYQKYKMGMSRMESDFQELFATAYEEGTVPPIDYHNLADYDWKCLVDWTIANVDSVAQAVPELPAERSELDELYTLEETTEVDMSHFYEIDAPAANHARSAIINRRSYICPLHGNRDTVPSQSSGSQLATARTWVRANVLTPEATYNANAARTRLLLFPEPIIEDALRTLLTDRVLMTQNNGRLMPGRNYDVSEYFFSRLKKNLRPAHFHRAASFKRTLDREVVEKGCATYSYTADDGDVLAILNLIAHKRIVVVPVNPPLNKWGLTNGGYETRQMDKGRLNFAVEIRPLRAYIHGSPLHPLPPPPAPRFQQSVVPSGPRGDADANFKIPLWYDINVTLMPVMWEMALAAVMAVLAVRPGVSAGEIEKTVRPSLETWEIGEILEWMVEIRAGERAGKGRYTTSEWWWMALEQERSETNTADAEKEGDHGVAVDKGKGKEKGWGWGWGEETMQVD